MRQLLEALGARVDWNETTRTATGTLGSRSVAFTIDARTYLVNGRNRQMDADIAPFVENGRTYIPIRYAAEGLGFTVDWDASTGMINIE